MEANGSFQPPECFSLSDPVRSKLPHHVATRSKGHQCTGLSRRFPKSMEVALCRATVPAVPTVPTVPTVPGLATLRDKQKLRSSEPRTFCLRYVLYVFYSGLPYVSIGFKAIAPFRRCIPHATATNCKVRQIEDRTHSRRWRLPRRRAWPAFDFAAIDHWEFGTSFTRWEHFELSTRACLRFARSVDPMVLDPTSDDGCLTIILPVSPSKGPMAGMVAFPATATSGSKSTLASLPSLMSRHLEAIIKRRRWSMVTPMPLALENREIPTGHWLRCAHEIVQVLEFSWLSQHQSLPLQSSCFSSLRLHHWIFVVSNPRLHYPDPHPTEPELFFRLCHGSCTDLVPRCKATAPKCAKLLVRNIPADFTFIPLQITWSYNTDRTLENSSNFSIQTTKASTKDPGQIVKETLSLLVA